MRCVTACGVKILCRCQESGRITSSRRMWATSARTACDARAAALLHLVEHTDVCSALLLCRTEEEQLRRLARACVAPPPDHARFVQSAYGSVRRTLSMALDQHPSIPLSLSAILKPPEPALGGGVAARATRVDVVLSRCTEPLPPLLSMLPSLLRIAHRRTVVYERCTPSEHLRELPSLDVRDRAWRIVRIGFRGGAGEAALAAHAARASAEPSATAADLTLFLWPGALDALGPPDQPPPPLLPLPPLAPLTARQARSSRAYAAIGERTPLSYQQSMQEQLRAQWADRPDTSVWAGAHGPHARLVKCLADELARPGEAGRLVGARAAAAGAAAEAPLAHPAANGTLALWVSRRGLHGVRQPRGWSTLLHSAPATACRTGPTGAEAGTSPTPASRQGAAEQSWPANASRNGFCGVTNDGVEGQCSGSHSDRGRFVGSWFARIHRIRSFADCAGRCVACARCAFVTYSPANDDCSWYSYSACSLDRLSPEPSFRTVQVRGPPARGGAPTPVSPLARAALASYARAARSDRRWARRLLRGAFAQLLSAASIPWTGDAGGGAAAAPAAAALGRGGGAGGAISRVPAGRMPLVHPACTLTSDGGHFYIWL